MNDISDPAKALSDGRLLRLATSFRIVGVDLRANGLASPKQWVVIVERGVTDLAGGWVYWCDDRYTVPVSESEARALGALAGREILIGIQHVQGSTE